MREVVAVVALVAEVLREGGAVVEVLDDLRVERDGRALIGFVRVVAGLELRGRGAQGVEREEVVDDVVLGRMLAGWLWGLEFCSALEMCEVERIEALT